MKSSTNLLKALLLALLIPGQAVMAMGPETQMAQELTQQTKFLARHTAGCFAAGYLTSAVALGTPYAIRGTQQAARYVYGKAQDAKNAVVAHPIKSAAIATGSLAFVVGGCALTAKYKPEVSARALALGSSAGKALGQLAVTALTNTQNFVAKHSVNVYGTAGLLAGGVVTGVSAYASGIRLN